MCGTSFLVGQNLLHVWSIWKPGKTVNMRVATMLPLKAEPVISGTKNSNVEGSDEFLDTVIKEPVGSGRVLLDNSLLY